MHVVTTARRSGEAVYNATLLRRSYRENGTVRKETLANLSCRCQEVGLRASSGAALGSG